jgi:hypothetical protein
VTDDPKYLYDVAISFLSGDEPLALKLYEKLSESLSVFLYSKKQEQLAGTDGLESFRQAFFSKSLLIVVLYRDGWGQTRWTAVEELAIKERMFNGDWPSLLFVMLDQQSKYPAWLPETHIRLDYTRFADNLVGAIRLRVIELGGKLKIETALEKARRMEAVAKAQAERIQKLTYEAGAAVATEWANLRRLLDEKIAEIKTHFKLQHGADERQHVIRTDVASLLIILRPVHAPSDSHITVGEFIGRLILPEEQGNRMYVPGNEPQRNSEHTYYFDYDASFGWCWRTDDGQLLNTDSLAESILKRILEFHAKVESGKVTRRHQSRNIRSEWS